MSANTDNPLPQEALVQATAAIANAVKIAKAAQEQAAKAPKAAAAEEIEKAAKLLVSHGYLDPSREAEAKSMLSDPGMAVQALQNVILKSAEAIRNDPRLASGRSIPAGPANRTGGPQMKQAAEVESEADRIYAERVASYRNNGVAR